MEFVKIYNTWYTFKKKYNDLFNPLNVLEKDRQRFESLVWRCFIEKKKKLMMKTSTIFYDYKSLYK